MLEPIKCLVKIGPESNTAADSYTFYISTPSSDSAVYACEGSQNNSCTADAGTRIDAKELGFIGNRRIFEMKSTVALSQGAVLSIFSAKNSGGSLAWSSEKKVSFSSLGLTLVGLSH